ncbi:hypothetical protein AMTRI_Chr11g152220 [Amborella trichopoda]
MEGETWGIAVEELVDRGDIDGAIKYLELLVTKFEAFENSSSDLRLASVLKDLGDLYSSKGLSLAYDSLLNRSLLIKQRAERRQEHKSNHLRIQEKAETLSIEEVHGGSLHESASSDDDWEAIADQASSRSSISPLPELSTLKLENEKCVNLPKEKENDKGQPLKRRGRGAFMYNQNVLYSEQQNNFSDNSTFDEEGTCRDQEDASSRNCAPCVPVKYGTNHVLVLGGFSPKTTTTYLEKAFEGFRDQGVVIRWVNDTTALAVFQTPALDLEPPYPRPKTSASTAQRLIAQGMGQRVSSNFGIGELRKQEEARRNRIQMRQKMRDEAWGADDP